jgi:hypothetical protein
MPQTLDEGSGGPGLESQIRLVIAKLPKGTEAKAQKLTLVSEEQHGSA